MRVILVEIKKLRENEVIRSVVGKDADITEAMITAGDELMVARMQEIAATLVSELEESRQGHWDFLSQQKLDYLLVAAKNLML